VAASPPDGTTLAFLASTTLVAKLGPTEYPFDPQGDLTPISLAGTWPMGLAVSPRIGVTTLDEFAAWTKDGEAERRRVGVTATDALLQVYAKTVGRAIDVPLEGVGYRGALPLASDLASGKLPTGMGGVTSFLEHHRGGMLRMLAISGRPTSRHGARGADGQGARPARHAGRGVVRLLRLDRGSAGGS
jgi:tripartite-type tricarboxylate transporter receptor subunit TctC